MNFEITPRDVRNFCADILKDMRDALVLLIDEPLIDQDDRNEWASQTSLASGRLMTLQQLIEEVNAPANKTEQAESVALIIEASRYPDLFFANMAPNNFSRALMEMDEFIHLHE